MNIAGADPEILKKGRSKKAEISFWQNIVISIFKFSPSSLIKSNQFFKIY